ncbi:hypothetical protein H2200_005865 [Cladophialophora chaetospira]|uniref:1-alkyl-2-acetylglycerophosphocholine esterase n=1 Tax=Cladophialophora chaetospira TaxID=386627 RepID=A0AA39CI04_9EURO|nr:hypothetical protein H2200_005865 [Cladophialophora chaetospira]
MARLFFLLSIPLAVLCQTIDLPPPPTSNVFITTFPITDYSRMDPLAPTKTPRRLMASLFQPANCTKTQLIPYMPPATAAFHDSNFSSLGIPNGTFEALRLQVCPSAPKKTDFPLLLFSTGAGTSRLLYNVICQWIASVGFNVVSIDHTYDALVVEFPDGAIIPMGNKTLPDDSDEILKVRVADVHFVFNALSNKTLTANAKIPQLKTKRVGMFGHSFGGATAGGVMLVEPRVVGGLNMDGSMWGPALNKTQKNPFTIIANRYHNQSDDATWAAFWPQLKGMKLQLQVNGTEHGSFVDYPILANSIGINSAVLPAIEPFIGDIEGLRMLKILRTYIGGFFQEVLESKKVKILQGPSTQFPEVTFANSSFGAEAN